MTRARVARLDATALAFVLLGGAFVALVVLWSLAIPFNGAPDEFTHFFLVDYIFLFRDMPAPGVDPARPFTGVLSDWSYKPDTFWYYGLPYLNSLLGVASASVLVHHLPPELAFLGPRAANWALAGVFFAGLVMIGRGLDVRPGPLALLAIVFAAVPQVTFIFAYFNADAFALTVTTLSLAAFVWMLRKRTAWAAISFGLLCGLVACSKLYYYPAFVFYALVIAFLALLDRGPILRPALWAILAATLVAGPYLTLVYIQFGEITGMSGQIDFTARHRDPAAGYGMCFAFCESEIVNWDNLTWWLESTFRSYFYGLGWMEIWLEDRHYHLFFFPLASLLLLVTLARGGADLASRATPPAARLLRPFMIFLFWSMAVCVVLANIYGSQNLLPQPQGRYLFVTVPFAFLMACLLLGAPRLLVRAADDPARKGAA